MKIAKNISLGIGMQVLVLLMHILIHFMDVMDGSFDDIQIACSFVAVILITYLAVLCFARIRNIVRCGYYISVCLDI